MEVENAPLAATTVMWGAATDDSHVCVYTASHIAETASSALRRRHHATHLINPCPSHQSMPVTPMRQQPFSNPTAVRILHIIILAASIPPALARGLCIRAAERHKPIQPVARMPGANALVQISIDSIRVSGSWWLMEGAQFRYLA